MKLSVTSGQDWFDLSGELDYGDDAVASLPDVLRALRRKSSVVRLSDGSEGELPAAWLARFARLVGLGESHETGIRFGNHQALWLDLLLEEAGSAVADTTFRGVVERLRQLGEPREVREPKAFRGDLRAYQRIGLSWMNRLHEAGLGGCLADDMGLGKTIQVLAFLLRHRRTLGKCAALVVCPRSVVGNWLTEASRFAPTLRVVDASVPDRDLAALDRAHLAVTTYGIVRRDIATLKDCEFSFVILDEAQMIKNASSLTAKATRLLRAPQRFALSGTPIENHLGDLWSQMEFLNPGLLGRARGFQAALKAKDGLEYADVARAVAPFVLRRTKERVATELPPKVEQTITCKLDKAQRRIYDELAAYYRLSLRKRVAEEGAETARMHVLEALLRLRQAACHPALIDPDSKVGSAKFELVLERLPEIVETGHKVLVFSQFTTLLGLLRVEIEAAGIGLAYLDGRTRKRDAEIERFQNDPACSVFLISLKAGGTGLNLTAADYVFVLDPWWNPAAESQAIDRAHRIGQSRSVLAYRLIAEDTIEQKIQALQEEKRALAAAVIKSDASALPGLSVEALLDLLG